MRKNKISHSLPSLWKTGVFLVIVTVLGAVLFVTSLPRARAAETPKAANNVANINTPPAPMGGGSSDDNPGATCTICHNHRNIPVACSNVENYLSHHPGDTAGACEATPASNR